ncbi:MAG TPA: AAA family ATPase, partial [Stellaceae bacterium]|nr:AAA family ATPase [Stellaceae bacterium]
FNKEPYSLGSFKEMAHYRGGKAGRAGNFTFSISTPINLRTARTAERPRARNVDIQLNFREVEAQPSISSVSFRCGEFQVTISIQDKVTISYQLPGMHNPHAIAEEDLTFLIRNSTNFNAIGFLMNSLPIMLYSGMRSGNRKPDEDAADEFRDILRATINSLPRLIFSDAPVRTKPARTYDSIEAIPSPEGAHIPYLLARLKAFKPADWDRLRNNLNDFGSASGLFSDIDVKKFGASPASPFQIAVKVAGPSSNLIDVGYGVSQTLPVIVETLQANRRSMFLLQQPEVHLHPKAQAALGSYLGAVAKQKGLTIVVETHSDFLIDRIRMDVRDNKGLDPSGVSILFFERTGLDVRIHQLEIDRNGNVLGAPPSYRQFFLEEQRRSVN